MKFIRKEFIVTTIFDKELTEQDEILIVFNNLLNESIEFSMIMKKFTPSFSDCFNLSFKKVKVKKINENDTLDLLIFKNGVKTSMKQVRICDVVEVEANTKKYKILDVDSDIDRFDILDL